MKNLLKLFGIAALVAVIGFSFAACGNGTTDNTNNNNNNQQSQAPDVTFTLSDGTAGDNKFSITVSGAEWRDHPDVLHNVKNLTGIIDLSLSNEVETVSADKKTVEVAIYEGGIAGSSIDEDITITVTFSDDADSQRDPGNGLIGRTSVNFFSKNEFWKTDDDGFSIYQGTITLVGEPVSITVKNDDKPE